MCTESGVYNVCIGIDLCERCIYAYVYIYTSDISMFAPLTLHASYTSYTSLSSHTSDISMFAQTISDFSYNFRVIYQYNPIACMLDEGIRLSISQIATCGENPAQVLGFNV